MIKKIEKITEFIETYGTKVKARESMSYVELMMDDHFCIKYNGKLYYIPEDNSLYTRKDELICDYLKDNAL